VTCADDQLEHATSHPSKGHDLSSLKTLEDSGNIFKDTARHNQTNTADVILSNGGMNSVRLRIWVNPKYGTTGLDYNLVMGEAVSRGRVQDLPRLPFLVSDSEHCRAATPDRKQQCLNSDF
jgi:hypothetical protein